MSPQIIAVGGPVAGAVHRLEGDSLSMGRDPSNTIRVDDRTVSRKHCKIELCDRGWRIIDLETRNGTFVNGLPIQSKVLAHRDEVRIGTTRFVFVQGDEMAGDAAPAEVLAAGGGMLTRTMEILAPASPQLATIGVADSLDAGERHSRELAALLKINMEILEIRDVPSLQARLMESIFRIVPAQRGSIVLVSAQDGEVEASYGWDAESGPCAAATAPEALTRRTLAERAAVCVALSGGGGSMLVAPMLSPGRPLGAIVVETAGSSTAFDQGHLKWLAALAVIAAPAFENLRRIEWLQAENRRLLEELELHHRMIGESEAMKGVLGQVARAGPAEATVLIHGETGTGKELVARALHDTSRRSGRPFVSVNCATLSESLLESDLFGHEKGAFTGAIGQKRGKLEVAAGGTLFLDEVGELAAPIQAKLLRVLQEREFERVGGVRPIRADIRLIAATNRNLEDAVQAGAFRKDLFYRLNVVLIHVPPLRERREDIPLLATYFLSRFSRLAARSITGISRDARAMLCSYDWPGNVRELENAIERATVLGCSESIEVEDLPETILDQAGPRADTADKYHNAVREAKCRIILTALAEAKGSQVQAARSLGINPTYLSRLIRNLNLKATVIASAS